MIWTTKCLFDSPSPIVVTSLVMTILLRFLKFKLMNDRFVPVEGTVMYTISYENLIFWYQLISHEFNVEKYCWPKNQFWVEKISIINSLFKPGLKRYFHFFLEKSFFINSSVFVEKNPISSAFLCVMERKI